MKCAHCGARFLPGRSDQRYCTSSCRAAAHVSRQTAADRGKVDADRDRVMALLPDRPPSSAERIALLEPLADEFAAGTLSGDVYCAFDRALLDLALADLDESFDPSIL